MGTKFGFKRLFDADWDNYHLYDKDDSIGQSLMWYLKSACDYNHAYYINPKI